MSVLVAALLNTIKDNIWALLSLKLIVPWYLQLLILDVRTGGRSYPARPPVPVIQLGELQRRPAAHAQEPAAH
jgi:hypothetical protein